MNTMYFFEVIEVYSKFCHVSTEVDLRNKNVSSSLEIAPSGSKFNLQPGGLALRRRFSVLETENLSGQITA